MRITTALQIHPGMILSVGLCSVSRSSLGFYDGLDSDEDLSFPTLTTNTNTNRANTNSTSRLSNSQPAQQQQQRQQRKSRVEEEPVSEDLQQKLQLLLDMGFPDRAENLDALRHSNQDVASAIDFMMAKNLEDII
jgi:hypothetical protein